ncbi:TPA: hypothetical protein DEP34_02090 [Candidatus Uhrbacteria bacterium]|nr:hypothetical protein [Candidatus Uhrbacteria bacterium]HCB19152.1 hypothetical protein [Candidatus Uhrbacteria bacterium]
MGCLDVFFPRFCAGCKKEGTLWCTTCRETHPLQMVGGLCPFCESKGSWRTCQSCHRETFLDGLMALTWYADPAVRRVLTTWKYVGDQAAEEVVRCWIRQKADHLDRWCRDVVIVPVPLHKRKCRARGFDQAQVMAQMVAQEMGGEWANILSRVRFTLPQAQRGGGERMVGDLDDIFEVVGEVPDHIVLCDDVFTSGATMDAAAKCLKDHGAKEVRGLVIAKGSVDHGTGSHVGSPA